MAIPELEALRRLRETLARGGLRALDTRTPEDHARIATFEVLAAMLSLLDEFKRRVEAGERCRLVKLAHSRKPGRFLIEIGIEAET